MADKKIRVKVASRQTIKVATPGPAGPTGPDGTVPDPLTTTLKGVSLAGEAEGTTGAALTLDYSKGNVHTATLGTEDCTISITNPPASGKEGKLKLVLTTGATLPSTVTYPAGVVPPTLVESKRHHLIFSTVDGGTSWDLFHAKQEGF